MKALILTVISVKFDDWDDFHCGLLWANNSLFFFWGGGCQLLA